LGIGGLVRLYHLPVLRQLLDLGYALIAHIRGYLPGTEPFCRRHPECCQAKHESED
jgi:hypothetical protein